MAGSVDIRFVRTVHLTSAEGDALAAGPSQQALALEHVRSSLRGILDSHANAPDPPPLVLSTAVSIGHDVPWRTVQDVPIQAARATLHPQGALAFRPSDEPG